ncbi:MAG: type II CAAX endopeptidase family protein [bacterium]
MNESTPPPATDPPGPQAPAVDAGEPPPTPGALPRVGWGPGQVLIGLVVLLTVTIVEVMIVSAFDSGLDSLGARLTLQAMLAGSLVAVAFLMSAPGALTPSIALGLRRPLVAPWKPAAIAYLAYVGCAILIAVAIQPEQDNVTEELGYGENALGDAAIGFFIIIVAPITEELFFRGFMFVGMRRRLPFVAAAAISAGLWGLFHYTGAGTWGVVLQLAVFGIALSWLYERTGSIWPPVAIHAFNNALAFVILTS